MLQLNAPVTSIESVGLDIYVMGLHAPAVASSILPGQFINIRVHDYYQPLLRRPFSVHRVDGERIEILFNIVGEGTSILRARKIGDSINILGPLGCAFQYVNGFDTPLLVGGGMGVAPMPILTSFLKKQANIVTFLGARSKNFLITRYLENTQIATDDGTVGYKGTVVELMRDKIKHGSYSFPKIFACGPYPMLKAVLRLAQEFNIPCEMSLESVMACGIGICQGCPVENVGGEKKYSLICKDGPVFKSDSIVLS